MTSGRAHAGNFSPRRPVSPVSLMVASRAAHDHARPGNFANRLNVCLIREINTGAQELTGPKGVAQVADRVLRGSRLGAVSYETDRNHDLAPRQIARYRTENGEEFEVPFADDAEIPGSWLCRNGMEGTLIEGDLPEPKKVKPPRTHWDMLLERRSVEELEELLKERLELIRSRRRG